MQAPEAEVLATARRLILAATVMALPLAIVAGPAGAQGGFDLSTENVTVDLSVIGEPGGRAQPGAAATSPVATRPGGGLLVPGSSNPTSQLHVAVPYGPDGGVKLRPPSTAPKKTSAKTDRKPAAATTPAPKKSAAPPVAPPVAATEPPAPLTAPPPAPAVVAAPVTPATKSALPAPPAAAEPAKPKEVPATAVAAAPSPAPVPAPARAIAKQASTPPAAGDAKETRALQVIFPAEASKLPNEAKDGLLLLSKKIKDNDTLRLQLLAYAGDKDLPASKARRLSLSRALSVRSYLIENGIRSTRIDVRALGEKVTDEPVNRVDVNVVER